MSAVVRSQPMFRPMQSEQLEAVHAIERAAYRFPWTLGIFADCLKVGYSSWVVADPDSDGIAGYGILSLAAGEGHILNLCIHPDRRRRGLGRLLLQHLMEVAEQYGASELFLEVRPSNEEALGMYFGCGFVEVGRRHDYYPSGKGREDALVLAKHL